MYVYFMIEFMTTHQNKQREVIAQIEKQIQDDALTFSTVSPIADFDQDPRICLTSVHFPKEKLKQKIIRTIQKPLQEKFPHHYYYPQESLHMTIKNIRVINNPPHFTDSEVEIVKKVFTDAIPKHYSFNVYFYRLLVFPSNLALIGTTDPKLDDLVLDLDRKLKEYSVADDKIYINKKYFFSNMTLVRFTKPIDASFEEEIMRLSRQLDFESYMVDSVTLLQGSATLHKKKIIHTWTLGKS